MIAALGAARAQDREEHARLAGAVGAAAAALGEDTYYDGFIIQMGPAMAAVQRVGELADLYEPKRALELAGRLPADPLPTVGRRCYHRIHQAKACFLRRQDGEALRLLAEAERIGPEFVRYEPMVREMVRALRHRRTRVPSEVRALAERLQVLPGRPRPPALRVPADLGGRCWG